jgi:hypothetical protein
MFGIAESNVLTPQQAHDMPVPDFFHAATRSLADGRITKILPAKNAEYFDVAQDEAHT